MIEPNLISKAIRTVNPNADRIHIQDENNYSATDSGGNEIVFDIRTETEIDRIIAEYDALQYQRDRQYPTWQEQMDMQYHDELNGTTTWKDAVAKVKADNPKPE